MRTLMTNETMGVHLLMAPYMGMFMPCRAYRLRAEWRAKARLAHMKLAFSPDHVLTDLSEEGLDTRPRAPRPLYSTRLAAICDVIMKKGKLKPNPDSTALLMKLSEMDDAP